MHFNHSSDIGYHDNALWINISYIFNPKSILIAIDYTVIDPHLLIVQGIYTYSESERVSEWVYELVCEREKEREKVKERERVRGKR